MLLTITNLAAPATDLGFLLHKHPDKVQEVPLSFGKAHVFYPEAGDDRCTAALLLEVDTVALARGHHEGGDPPLEPYVNDRPYVASSFLSVALSRVFGTALHGRCEKREPANRSLSLVARLSVLPCRGGESLLWQLFEPLGYGVQATHHALDPRFPDWAPARPSRKARSGSRTNRQWSRRNLRRGRALRKGGTDGSAWKPPPREAAPSPMDWIPFALSWRGQMQSMIQPLFASWAQG
jgi:hypothetical protein